MRPSAILLATTTLLGNSMARAAPPSAGDAPPAAETPAPPAAPADGWLTVVCRPECDGAWDGTRDLGTGSIVHRPMVAGVHQITVARGLARRTYTVTIDAGKGTETEVSWAPPPSRKHSNEAMRIAGIVITSMGIAMVPIGLGLWFGTPYAPAPPCSGGLGDGCFSFFPIFTSTQVAGMVTLTLGYSIFPAIGIPLWVNGAKPANPDASAALASWSFAPLTLPPLRGSSSRAPGAPAGLAFVGTF